ncbi:hypothetical protein MRY82_01175 [bacterium]|nr:hypothetical protein [bacterium]
MQTGALTLPTIQGLKYTTSTGDEGFTNASGQFKYNEGDEISFWLGKVLLGKIKAKKNVYLLGDIVRASYPTQLMLSHYDGSTSFLQDHNPEIQKLMNLVLCLLTIDNDQDFVNGIVIAKEVHEKMNEAVFDLDFLDRSDDFIIQFRKVMLQSNLQKAPRSKIEAIRALINAEMYQFEFLRFSSAFFDNDGDGQNDTKGIPFYNDYGDLNVIHLDEGIDDNIDEINTTEYDERGNETYSDRDQDGDGTPESISNSSYDLDNNLIYNDEDYDGDGNIDYIMHADYDDYGNLLQVEYDYDGDTVTDQRSLFSYDSLGNKIKKEQDLDANGSVDIIENYIYDNDLLVRVDYDYNADEIADEKLFYTYDEHGNLLLEERDFNLDGTMDSRITKAYNVFNQLITAFHDNNADGIFESTYTYIYNSEKLLTEIRDDDDANGQDDDIRKFYYDDYRNIIRVERDADGDGQSDAISYRTYNSKNFPVTIQIDEDADSDFEEIINYEYELTDKYLKLLLED